MKLEKARTIAEEFIEMLSPRCECIEIAGSIRRRKPEVKDIELVAIPKVREERDLFGELLDTISELDEFDWSSYGEIIKNGSKYKQIRTFPLINLDLFIVLPPAQWGVIFAIRTGPADYSRWLVTQQRYGGAMPAGYFVQEGQLWGPHGIIPTPEESDFFAEIGLICPLPWDRSMP